jgi:hypothetical protein
MGSQTGYVDEALQRGIRLLNSVDEVGGASLVDAVELGLAAGLHEAGGVDDTVHPPDGAEQGTRVGDIAESDFVWELEEATAAGWAQEEAHFVAAGGELLGDMRSEEAAGAGGQHLHDASIFS